MKVYIVDDSKAIRERLIARLRENTGVEHIDTAEGVEEVKSRLTEFLPDVVIIDIHLKQGTGFDVLNVINQTALKPLKIVLTNHALPPYKDKAMKLGVDYFFDKSNDFNEAIAVVGEFRGRRSQAQEV